MAYANDEIAKNKEPYKAVPNTNTDNTLINEKSPSIVKKKEPYRAIPVSEMTVLKEDGTVDTLDHLIQENESHEIYRARPNQEQISIDEKGECQMKTTQEKIAELKALKAEVEYARSLYENDGESADNSTMGNAQARHRTVAIDREEASARSLYEQDSMEYSSSFTQSQYQQAEDAYENNNDEIDNSQDQTEEQKNTLVLRRSR